MSGIDTKKLSKNWDLLNRAVDVTLFRPSNAHTAAKTAFWSHFASSLDLPPETIDLETAMRISGHKKISEWWDLDGFVDWFSNKDEFRQRVEYLANIALTHIEGVLTDEKTKSGEKVQAIKIIMDLAAKFPQKSSAEHFADEKIGEMSKTELEQFISGKIKYLPQVK